MGTSAQQTLVLVVGAITAALAVVAAGTGPWVGALHGLQAAPSVVQRTIVWVLQFVAAL